MSTSDSANTPTNMPHLTQEQRERVIGMIKMRATPDQVAGILRCIRTMAYMLMIRYRQTGTTSDRSIIGRSHVTSSALLQYNVISGYYYGTRCQQLHRCQTTMTACHSSLQTISWGDVNLSTSEVTMCSAGHNVTGVLFSSRLMTDAGILPALRNKFSCMCSGE